MISETERNTNTPTTKPLDHLIISDTEKDIVQRAKQGDEEAFGLLYTNTLNDVNTVSRKVLGSGDKGRVEDISQDVYLKAYQALPKYQHRMPIRYWIKRITHNVAVSRLRKSGTERKHMVGTPMTEEDLDHHEFSHVYQESESDNTLEGKVLEEEKMRAIFNSLSKMKSQNRRLAVTYKYILGNDYKEIAQKLGVTTTLARVLVHRGLEEIKNDVRQEGFIVSDAKRRPMK